MHSSQFQALIKALKSEPISKFISLVDQFTGNEPNNLTNSRNYNQFRANLEKAYYEAISERLISMKNNFVKSKEDVAQLFDYSDKLGIFIDVSNIDAEGIISELHIDGLKKGLRSRIIELVSFFNKYNLFERNFTADELKIIQDIKDNNKLLAVNLKELFGTVSDSLIFYVCKVMSYDYVKWIRDMLKNPRGHNFVMNPNSLKNWTDGYVIYDLVVRNLGSVEEFIKKVEDQQKVASLPEDMILLEFSPIDHYRIYRGGLQRMSEIHIVCPEIIKQHKASILNKDNYNFYSLSMVLIGGTGPEGLGFTYSTPKGEVIEICSDQKETEAIVIKFKQYLKNKFLDKLESEMERLGVKTDIIEGIYSYLSEILNPEDLVSYNDMDSILKKIKSLLDYEYQQYKFELDEIMSKISKVFSKIYSRKIKIWFKLFFNRRVLRRLEKEMVNMDANVDIRGRIIKFLADSISPKDFFKYYDDNTISDEIGKLLSDEFQQLNEDIISKTSKAVSIILREIKLKDQFKTRMDLVGEGKIKSEDLAKLTSLRGKSHYDVLRERFFFQNEVNWFFKDYPNEIKELNKNFSIL